MANFLSRLAHGVAQVPHRVLVAAGWAQMEPAGLGVTPAPTDLDAMEDRRREEQEVLRQGSEEERSPDPD